MLEKNRKKRAKHGIKPLIDTNGNRHGWIIGHETVTDNELGQERDKVWVHDPEKKKNFPEYLDRKKNTSIHDIVVLETPDFVLTERINPTIEGDNNGDKDDNNFRIMVNDKASERFRDKARKVDELMKRIQRLDQKLERHRTEKQRLRDTMKHLRKENQNLRRQNNSLSERLSKMSTTVNKLKSENMVAETNRRKDQSAKRKEVQEATKEGEYSAKNRNQQVKDTLEEINDIRAEVSANDDNSEIYIEVMDKLNKLEQKIEQQETQNNGATNKVSANPEPRELGDNQ